MAEARANILVVDDQPDNLRMLSAILQQEGFKVRKAIDGEVALETIYSHPPDLILLDIRMPNMDGYAICTTLKQDIRTQDIPVIFLSALDDIDDKIKAFEVGGADYITKPFRAKEVLARISNQLTIRQQQQQLLEQNQQLLQQIQERRLLGMVVSDIRRSLRLEKILQATVHEVRQLFQLDRVFITRFQTDGAGKVVAEAASPAALSLLGQLIDQAPFCEYWSEEAKRQRVNVITNVTTSSLPTAYLELLTSFQVQASLAVPIVEEGTVWGLLVADQCSVCRIWKQWEIDFFEQLSGQLAIAIHQAELYHQVQHLNSDLERQVQARTLELQQALTFEATLKRITDKVRDSLDEIQMLETAMNELANALQIDYCETTLYNVDDTVSIIRYQTDEKSLSTIEPYLLNPATFPEFHTQSQQIRETIFCPAIQDASNSVAILVMPICGNQSTVVGSLRLFKPNCCSFGEQEIHLVKQVTHQCAIALYQARLYQASQAQVRELQRLNELKNDRLNTLADELQTPIAHIHNTAQRLANTIGQTQPLNSTLSTANSDAAQDLKIIQELCEREIELIQNLIRLQDLEAGNYGLKLTTVNLQE